jgi:putative ABC transport system permease protein
MMPDMATGMSADLPEEVGREIRQVSGIESLETFRLVRGRAEGGPVIVVVRGFASDSEVSFDLKAGDPNRLRQQLFAGEVVVGSVLAQRQGLQCGGTIALETLQGTQHLRIAGVVNEYMVGGLTVYMERGLAERLLGVEGVDAYIVHAVPHALNDVERQLLDLCNKHGLLLHSFADIRQLIEGMIAGVVGCEWGILALGFVVASIGVVNTLTMNVLEQTRELGVLRIVAMTRNQVRKTIYAQAVFIAIIGVLPGLAAGVLVAYLISLATAPVIGHAVEFGFHPVFLASCAFIGMAIVILSAVFPVERAARLNLVTALQYE